ncbi:RING-type domain-containing protein [Citrus sinensis]|uniref:RING-type domain-containing protein n=1 Tax=Citrus sinensis TaxID=2711 RepID=A0ACB8MQ28_CITSI|nr:RING-type domain-containing protein [Citrus sinensis]KAH9788027.1 RING-type domain-containing protein [Citrus sinensis]
MNPPADAAETSPLLAHSLPDHLIRSRRLLRRPPPPLRGAAARLLRRASGRRLMLREPSVRVRETAAEQLEERQSYWAYSRPIIVLDVLWNLVFVIVAFAVLGVSINEKPEVPLRLRIVGYALQCLFHVFCVSLEFKRRRRGEGVVFGDSVSGSSSTTVTAHNYYYFVSRTRRIVAKNLESANTFFSFLWWIVGFYWITASGETLISCSPQLYWLCVTFLAFDVVFVMICVGVACLIGIAVCCCLPCILGILYALTEREGATEEEIDRLPKFKFSRIDGLEKVNGEIQEPFGGIMIECDTDMPMEHVISEDDAECCICLSAYDDGTELRELPCLHHFHCSCLDKWLYINSTCPLCKFNILKMSNERGSEEV